MKRLITATALGFATILAPLATQATPLYHPSGANLTYGAVSNGQSIMSDITNPAAGAAALQQGGNQYRFGILSSIGAGFEFGKIDDLYDKIDTQANVFAKGASVSADDFTGSINSVVGLANSVLSDVASPDAYAKVFASVHLPLMPLVVAHKALGGSIVFDVNGSMAAKVSALQTDVLVDAAQLAAQLEADIISNGSGVYTSGDVTINVTDLLDPLDPLDPFDRLLTIDNDSSVIVRAATITELAMGYSRPVMRLGRGTVYGGLRGRYYKVGVARAYVRLGSLVDGAEQTLDDAADENFVTDAAFGLDVGLLWINDHFRLGANLTNINEPDFEFGDINNIGSYSNASILQQIRTSNSYTMDKQLQLEAGLYTANQNWVISGGLDANAVEDVLGDEYRWATVSTAYVTDTWWLPGIRAGFRKNLAGSNINYYTLGVTMAVVNVDLAWSSDKVTIDGSRMPRGGMFNVGLEVSF